MPLIFSFLLCLVSSGFVVSAWAQSPIVQVTASDFQAPNAPYNTLDQSLETRWSAQGNGVWIQYEFLEPGWYVCGAQIAWFQGDKRISFFQVRGSFDGVSWQTIFDGQSQRSNGLESYSFVQGSCRGPFKFLRIVGDGNTQNNWTSITAVQIFGGSTDGSFDPFPGHTIWAIETQTGDHTDVTGDLFDIADYDVTSAWHIPADTWLDIMLTPNDRETHTACIALAWEEPSLAFRVEVINGEEIRTVLTTQSQDGGRTLTVYSLDPNVDQGNPYLNRFRITPLHEDGHLAEIAFLYDCDVSQRRFVHSVYASAYQPPNGAGNTLDQAAHTRWSAQGEGQWIQYDFGADVVVSTIGIQWYNGAKRTAFFDIEMSLNGIDWYPALLVGQSRRTGVTEWYDFDQPTFGRLIRIVGRGNTVNTWNSITKVVFGADSVS